MSSKRKLIYKDIDTLRFLAIVPIILYCLFYLLNSYKDNLFHVSENYKKWAGNDLVFNLIPSCSVHPRLLQNSNILYILTNPKPGM